MKGKKDKASLQPAGIQDESGSDGSSMGSPEPEPGFAGEKASGALALEIAKPASPKMTPPAESSPPTDAEKKPSVPLRVFASLSGVKRDQFTPFEKYARREGMLPCPVAEWHERFQQFLKKPVR